MAEFSESDYNAFEQDIELLVDTFKKIFESDNARYYWDDSQERLYLLIEGLDEFEQEEINEAAQDVLDELDLDFDEIVLLPLKE